MLTTGKRWGTSFSSPSGPVSVLSTNLPQLKGAYSTSDYVYLSTPRYGLGYPWLNLIIPGLSQYCMGEPGLGTMYLLLGVGSSIITGVGYGLVGSSAIRTNGRIIYEQPQFNTGTTLALIGLAANIAVTVTSIVNAYNVAKVKSLYAEDLRNYRQAFHRLPPRAFARPPQPLPPASKSPSKSDGLAVLYNQPIFNNFKIAPARPQKNEASGWMFSQPSIYQTLTRPAAAKRSAAKQVLPGAADGRNCGGGPSASSQ